MQIGAELSWRLCSPHPSWQLPCWRLKFWGLSSRLRGALDGWAESGEGKRVIAA